MLAYAVAYGVGIPPGPAEQVVHAVRCDLPAHSAMLQRFVRGRSDSSASTNSLTRHRGSTRANRPAIRDTKASNATYRQARSTL